MLKIVIFLILAAQPLSAAIKDSVVVVKPVISADIKAAYTDIANYFLKKGLSEAAEYFNSWAEGGHGSGFVIKLVDGSLVLVTNRHVASQADEVTLIVESSDGIKTEYNDCKVLFIDYILDIALIEIPSNAKIPALQLADTVPKDGTEVWSAGFPGFMKKPSWQLAKGNVSNQNVEIEDAAPKGHAQFIQHSASIDPGNSGGPLLFGDIQNPNSLRVVGINTLTAHNRNNTFFAVPVTKLKESLARYQKQKSSIINPKDAVSSAAQDFETFVNAEEWDSFAYLRLIANTSVSLSTWRDFENSLRTMSTKDRERWLGQFYTHPIDSLRQYISWKIWTKSQTIKSSFDSNEQSPRLEAENWLAEFQLAGQEAEITWVNEAGRWMFASSKIKGSAAPSSTTIGKTAPSAESKPNTDQSTHFFAITPTGFGLFLAATLAPEGSANTWPGLAVKGFYSGMIIDQVVVDFSAGIYRNHFTSAEKLAAESEQSQFSYNDSEAAADQYTSINFGVGVSWYLPISNENFYFAPFIGAHVLFGVNLAIFGDTLDTYGFDETLSSFFDLGLAPRIGFEFSFDRNIAFGIEGTLHWYLLGLKGIRSFPIGAYVKFVNIQ